MSLTKTQRVLITNVIFLIKFALEISDMTSDLLFEFHVTYHIIYLVKICTCIIYVCQVSILPLVYVFEYSIGTHIPDVLVDGATSYFVFRGGQNNLESSYLYSSLLCVFTALHVLRIHTEVHKIGLPTRRCNMLCLRGVCQIRQMEKCVQISIL